MRELTSLIDPIVVLANGEFPQHDIPLHELDIAGSIICCDGAVESLIQYGKRPQAIVGDFDSIPQNLKEDLAHILVHAPDQSENDLRKSLKWVEQHGGKMVTILGASGKREDHLLGNIFSILQFDTQMDMVMITDYGRFYTVHESQEFEGIKGQQVSLFSLEQSIKITTTGLEYPLQNESLPTLYGGTLNEVVDNGFTIKISHGQILIYCAF
jgi:thiamine pyrophosphokinase